MVNCPIFLDKNDNLLNCNLRYSNFVRPKKIDFKIKFLISEMSNTNYAIVKYEDGSVVPSGSLDNVLAIKNFDIKVKFHSLLSGKEINDSNKQKFYDQVRSLIEKQIYTTTDHLFIHAKVGDYTFLYVSLDNSVRANSKGFSLSKRLDILIDVVKKFINECNDECVIFFSESSRPSFEGGDINNRINEMSWFRIRLIIEIQCNLTYLGECTNNDNIMSFGVSAFCTKFFALKIHSILPRRFLTEGFGSGAIGIKLLTEEIVWGIHFPLDFRGKGQDNLGAKAMIGLCKLMDEYSGSVCAIGDFNTIPGHISQSIEAAISPDKEFIVKDEPTFFGAFYDTVKNDEEWMLL